MTMSYTATVGSPLRIARQVFPRSSETWTPCSLPTNNRSGFLESSSTTYTGELGARPADRFRQVLPPSVVRKSHDDRLSLRWPSKDTYAVLTSAADATTRLTHVPFGTSGTVASTSVQLAPPSRVSQRLPSSVPTQ